eukprot:gene1328-2049_t
MLQINVATDILKEKVNVQLNFERRPFVDDVKRHCRSMYEAEAALRCAQRGIPPVPFELETLRIYDECAKEWVELTAERQLHNYAQLFAFQPQASPHNGPDGPIPSAVSSVPVRG